MKCKRIIPFLFLIFALLGIPNVYGQFNIPMEKTVLVFEDGTEMQGLARLASRNRIKFKKAKGESAVKFNFDDLKYVVISRNSEKIKYVQINVKGKTEPVVVREITTGEISLYTTSSRGHNPGFGTGGSVATPGQFSYGSFDYNIDNYYMRRSNTELAVHLGSNQLFNFHFINATSDYFSDCKDLVNKIKNKEFKKKDIKAIVEYYNNQCK